ncbi:hypothetical protein [Spirosoma agri]|uniref:Uncharacterized protein n=1 Tax=Spirosoma agri TaxID=1987381 RepID=A0A6M0ING8_9BACT|nr:hypothetical protein [Spirosoma agri]NEU69870.1 hypothetical protein [Spirosoma agri]
MFPFSQTLAAHYRQLPDLYNLNRQQIVTAACLYGTNCYKSASAQRPTRYFMLN